jgi:hypothetical protein
LATAAVLAGVGCGDGSQSCGTATIGDCRHGTVGGICGDVSMAPICTNHEWKCPDDWVPREMCGCVGPPGPGGVLPCGTHSPGPDGGDASAPPDANLDGDAAMSVDADAAMSVDADAAMSVDADAGDGGDGGGCAADAYQGCRQGTPGVGGICTDVVHPASCVNHEWTCPSGWFSEALCDCFGPPPRDGGVLWCRHTAPDGSATTDATTDADAKSGEVAAVCCAVETPSCNCFNVGGSRNQFGACPQICDASPKPDDWKMSTDQNGCPILQQTASTYVCNAPPKDGGPG